MTEAQREPDHAPKPSQGEDYGQAILVMTTRLETLSYLTWALVTRIMKWSLDPGGAHGVKIRKERGYTSSIT